MQVAVKKYQFGFFLVLKRRIYTRLFDYNAIYKLLFAATKKYKIAMTPIINIFIFKTRYALTFMSSKNAFFPIASKRQKEVMSICRFII